jgi:hypothetical protein
MFLPAAKRVVDDQGDGDQEHRPPGDDEGVAEECEDQAGDPEEDVADVQEGDEVVDAGNGLGDDPWLVLGWVRVDPLEHAAGPPGALAHEVAESGGHGGGR